MRQLGEFGISEDETSYLGIVHSLSPRTQAAHSDSPGGVRISMLRLENGLSCSGDCSGDTSGDTSAQ